ALADVLKPALALTARLRSAAEQLARPAARWECHSRLGPATDKLTHSGHMCPGSCWTGPPSSRHPHLDSYIRRVRSYSRRQLFANAATIFVMPEGECPHPGFSDRCAAFALKMQPTTVPFESTSKSSSLHSPGRREADTRLRVR